MKIIELVAYIELLTFSILLLYFSIQTFLEKTFRASFLFVSLLVLETLYFILTLNYVNDKLLIFILVLSPLILILILFFPVKTRAEFQPPKVLIDERDIMFSRNELEPGSEKYSNYYKENPSLEEVDNKFRKLPGLMSEKSVYFNKILFSASEASFRAVEQLYPMVEELPENIKFNYDKDGFSSFILEHSKKLGAISSGITELKGYHWYSVLGRKERYGRKVEQKHSFAIAFTVEMSKENMQYAPQAPTLMESAQQYFEAGKIAVQIAHIIRAMGYNARAHIDGNYQVVCPLVARDAGLGEIGRMGLLMTPALGPRVRIGVVTTDMELNPTLSVYDKSYEEFCRICKKCAENCPANAISYDDKQEIEGIKRWKINQEKCFTLWCKFGTDCGRCVQVCPYSHPDNLMHNIVRFGIKQNHLFRYFANLMDNIFYGRKPAIKKLPGKFKAG